MKNRTFLFGLLPLAFAACVAPTEPETGEEALDGQDDSFLSDGKFDALGISEGSPEALGVLRVANELSNFDLTGEARVHSRSARNIIAHRAGSDDQVGTADDDQFDNLVELDRVYWVGPVAFSRLLSYARSAGYIPTGGTGTIDPTGEENTGTLRLVIPQPTGSEPLHDIIRRVRATRQNVNSNMGRSGSDYVSSALPAGSWCIELMVGTSRNNLGTTKECGVVVAGQETTLQAASFYVGDMDMMDTNIGPALGHVTINCEGGCEGRLYLRKSEREVWSQRFLPTMAGRYAVNFALPWMNPPVRTLAPGSVRNNSLVPETDHRKVIFMTADPVDLPSSRSAHRLTASSRYAASTFIQTRDPQFANVGDSLREADPILLFTRNGAGHEVTLKQDVNGSEFFFMLAADGAIFHHTRRIEVNHVTVSGIGPDGPIEHEVRGTYRVYKKWSAGTRTAIDNSWHNTGTGLDVAPGDYDIVVRHKELDGRIVTKEYPLDLR